MSISSAKITRIAVAGIGNVGVPVLESLLATTGLEKPVVLTRDPAGNKSLAQFKDQVTIVRVSYDDTKSVSQALIQHGIQALIATTGGANGPAQLPLVQAAKEANLKLYVSAEYGIDFRFIPDQELHPWILARKQFHQTLNEVRCHHQHSSASSVFVLICLASGARGASDQSTDVRLMTACCIGFLNDALQFGVPWISVANGLFAEFVLDPELGLDPKARTAHIVGDGKQTFGSTSLKDIGRATVLATLAPPPPAGKGRTYSITGFEASLQDWINQAQTASGSQWEVKNLSYDQSRNLQRQPDEEGFTHFLRAAVADGRFVVPPTRLDNGVLGFQPRVTLEQAVKGSLA